MTQHERNVIQASRKAHEAYTALWTGPGENPAAVKAWHETYRRELDAAEFDEDEQAMFLYGTGRL